MTIENMIKYLRVSVSVQDPTAVQDPAYLSMSDENLVLYLNVALSRDFPTISSLEYVTNMELYPLMLLTKKDLFHALAVKEAPQFDIGADNNNYLKRDQRFKHYMSLIEQVNKEYESYLTNGAGNNVIASSEVLLSSRYHTERNRRNGSVPSVTLYIDGADSTSVEISWECRIAQFFSYKVYLSESPIIDLYNVASHVSSTATLVETIRDSHQTSCRIKGLSSNTLYYVAIVATNLSLLEGYSELSFTTM